MKGKVPIVMAALVLLASGCVSEDCGGCADRCLGGTLLKDGTCSAGECRFSAASCEFGCSSGICLPEPPHLVISGNEETLGNFTVRIDSVHVRLGDFRDEYDVSMRIANTGNGSSVFDLASVSLFSKTGIMHHATGFSWSDMLEPLEEREISFTVRRVPDDRRNEDTTLIIRTNQGQYSFPARYSA